MNLILTRFVRTIWLIAVLVLVTVAVLVSLAKVTMPRLHQYRSEIQSYLSAQLATPVTLRGVAADWRNFQPILAVDQLTIGDTEVGVPLSISSLELRLDVLGSLLEANPVFASLLLKKVQLVLRQNQHGRWQFADRVSSARDKPIDLLELLLAQGRIRLEDIALVLIFNDGVTKQLSIPSLSFHCLKKLCASEGRALLSGESNAQLSFAMNLSSRPGKPDFNLQAFARWQTLPVGDWLKRAALEIPQLVDTEAIELGGELWLSVEKGRLNRMQGRLTVPRLEMPTASNETEPLMNLKSDFFWRRGESTNQTMWNLQLTDASFVWRETLFPINNQQWTLSKERGGKLLQGWVDSVDLEPLAKLVADTSLLPEKAKKIVATLQPSGSLENLSIQYPIADQESAALPRFSIKANIEGLSVSAWKHAPAGSGLDGYLELSATDGLVQFVSDDFRLHFPKLYSREWHFGQASGEVSWHNEGKSVWLKGRNLQLSFNQSEIQGQFDLDAAKDGTEPRLNLLIGMRGGGLHESLAFVPDRKLSTGLVQWLDQSIGTGKVDVAAFAYSGSAVKGASQIARSLRLTVNAEVDRFQYQKDWPALEQLKTNLVLSDTQVNVAVDSARLYESQVSDARASFMPGSEGGVVNVDARVTGPSRDGLRVLQDTPIRKALFDLVDDFQVEGDLQTELKLSIPLQAKTGVTSKVRVKTQNTEFKIPSLGLDFDRVQGDFSYGNDTGLHASGVRATLFREPVQADIKSSIQTGEGNQKASLQTQIQIDGNITSEAFYNWLPLPALTLIKGKTGYSANLKFGGGQENEIQIKTDLFGVQSDLPKPFNKLADEKRDLSFLIKAGDRQIHYLNYADQLNYALLFDQGGYRQGRIILGSEPAVVGQEKNIGISGKLPELDFTQWQSLFDLYQRAPATLERVDGASVDGAVVNETALTATEQKVSEFGFMQRLKQVDLNVGRFVFANQLFNSLALMMEQKEDAWHVQLENPEIKGLITSFTDPDIPTKIALEYLKLPQTELTSNDALQDVIPQELMLLDFKAERLSMGDQDFGAWAFSIKPDDKGALIDGLVADVRGLKLTGAINWRYHSARHLSEFEGLAVAKDTGDAVEAWGYSRSIEGKDGKISGKLKWSGSPAMFSLVDSVGELTIRGDEGRFIEVESSANVLRLFGILNFTSLARRLRLDFSDLFMKGYSFDKVRGKLALNQGKVEIVDSLIIDGPSAKFKIDGRTNLLTEELDQEMIVVLPLTDNIPLAATIVGAPQVGIPLYLINKIFGNMFERFTSARYKVTGTWEDPKIELVKMFENRSRGNRTGDDEKVQADTESDLAKPLPDTNQE